ncbi:MAG: hypothetical protein CTY31_10640 [Hyphomicrobium sp.]|nr:MAG: hypothetical protein CTY31_10640 [Hyphomicrobium sp.]
MVIGEALFVKGSLSSYFDQQVAALRPFVEKFLGSHAGESDETKIVQAILAEARVEPLKVDFSAASKDVQSAKVRIRDFGRDIEIDGVRATRTYPFTGDAGLFRLQPNTWTSVVPYGLVTGNRITIGIEDRNDPPSLKGHLDSQEELLRKYIDWQSANIEEHNRSLKPKIESLVAARLKHLDGVAKLKDMI